jgi:hypothetical protein
MKVYRIKYVEKEELDCGLFGPGYDEYEGFLPELYISEEVARKHMPQDEKHYWGERRHSIVEQEVIED